MTFPIAESTISVLLGFISGLACGVMSVFFYIRYKEKKHLDEKT